MVGMARACQSLLLMTFALSFPAEEMSAGSRSGTDFLRVSPVFGLFLADKELVPNGDPARLVDQSGIRTL